MVRLQKLIGTQHQPLVQVHGKIFLRYVLVAVGKVGVEAVSKTKVHRPIKMVQPLKAGGHQQQATTVCINGVSRKTILFSHFKQIYWVISTHL